jgi:transcriptional regulator with XRE-family HTH domain
MLQQHRKSGIPDDATLALGNDLRALRKSRGLTLNELAMKIGRSVGYVSQVERGLSSPSINDLRVLAKALDAPVSWFFMTGEADEHERGHVVRANGRRVLGTRESGFVEELLSPDLGGSFEMFRSEFQPGAELSEAVFRETEEAGYVVSGSLEFWIDDRHFELNAGDSFRFERRPYRWKNSGHSPCVVIWVVSPPVY